MFACDTNGHHAVPNQCHLCTRALIDAAFDLPWENVGRINRPTECVYVHMVEMQKERKSAITGSMIFDIPAQNWPNVKTHFANECTTYRTHTCRKREREVCLRESIKKSCKSIENVSETLVNLCKWKLNCRIVHNAIVSPFYSTPISLVRLSE